MKVVVDLGGLVEVTIALVAAQMVGVAVRLVLLGVAADVEDEVEEDEGS